MAIFRKLRVIVVVFALLALFAGAFTAITAPEAQAARSCCRWVMYCTTTPPIYCWDVCIPVPCH
ncbi:MAG: hypothetical protein R3F48_06350 [Candidatus Zixiibacteriota bacterium]